MALKAALGTVQRSQRLALEKYIKTLYVKASSKELYFYFKNTQEDLHVLHQGNGNF
jgi:hypothetical protein